MSPLRALPSCLGAMLAVLPMSCGGSGVETSSTASIAALAAPADGAGDVRLEFLVRDRDSGHADVRVLFSDDGGKTWRPATIDGGELRGLRGSPAGTRYAVVWDSIADTGFRTDRPVRVAVEIAPSADRRARTLESTLESTLGGRTPVARGVGPAAEIRLDNLGPAADRVESHLYYLGPLDAAKIKVAERHDLVVLQPCDPTVTRAAIAEIKNGVDATDPRDDVIVLGAVSIGLDLRTSSKTDAQMALDPRFIGDGTGPRVDPRGPNADGRSLRNVDPKGLPSTALGYAGWYLDDNSVDRDGKGDGKPDRSVYGNACFVNAGAPGWFEVVDAMRCDGPDRLAGMREIVTKTFGRGFDCDGLFLDHVDTCTPNFATDKNDPNQVEFEWTAPGFASFMKRVRARYPDKVVMQNRGLFFFNPNLHHYDFATGEHIDFVLFASYRLNANTHEQFNRYYFADNKYNVVPRLQAEAYRPDGFQVLSVGHATGPGIATDTLLGKSKLGLKTLLTDVFEAQNRAGFRHYLTDAHSRLVNDFVRKHSVLRDRTPPAWTSTWNGNSRAHPHDPRAPVARIGVQELEPGLQSITARWDVALDLNPVHYVAYLHEGDGRDGSPAKRIRLRPRVGAGYANGTGPFVYPYEATIDGLRHNRLYSVIVRAVDAAGNEDGNRVRLSARTLGRPIEIRVDGRFDDWDYVRTGYGDGKDEVSAGPDWRRARIFNDGKFLYVTFRSEHAFNLDGSPKYTYSRCLIGIDVDDDPFTGYDFAGIGSEILVAGDGLYRQKKDRFNAGFLGRIAAAPRKKANRFELAIPLPRLDAVYHGDARRIRVVFLNDEIHDRLPDRGHISYDIVR